MTTREPAFQFRLSFEGTTAVGAPTLEFDRGDVAEILRANGYRNLRHAGPGAHDHSWLCDDDRDEGYNVQSVLREIVRRRVFRMLNEPER